MATFIAITSSNNPRVIQPEALHQILNRYYLDEEVQAALCQDEEDGAVTLAIWGYDWPTARKVPKDAEPDWDQDGEEGFAELLKEVAPFLAEPLTVQAVGAAAFRFPLSACQWRVQPGEAGIEVTGFQDSLPESNQGALCHPISCLMNAS